ncbi:LamG-like jellyroll fold domain-containing protein [Planctomycetota bacterium]
MKNKHRQRLVWLALVSLGLSSMAQPLSAETISVNFNNGGATLLGPADEVGFVPATNWNNFQNNGGIGLFNPDSTPLVDSAGAESDATISWEVGASAFNSNNGQGNQRMMEGWFGLNEGDAGYISIEDIPESFTSATYDAYVYFDSDRVAPNERTMSFTVGDTTLAGRELPTNYQGGLFEASGDVAGNYVVFRDLVGSTFTLTADSDEGRAAINGLQITTLPEPDPMLPPDPNLPIHAYDASDDANSDDQWLDMAGNKHWSLIDVERLAVESANTSIQSAYKLVDVLQGSGGDVTPFESGNITYELWVRPGDSDENHQVIFETGGGQNGTSVLMNDETIRLLNSTGNERGFDIDVPLAGVDTTDFVQIVAALNAEDGEITLTVNGSAGGSASASDLGDIGRGGNRASLFTWGGNAASLGNAEDAPGGTFNLGGRTEQEDMTPEGLMEFGGEIALLNVYSRAFDSGEVQTAFNAIVSSGMPGDYNRDGVLDVLDLNLQTDAIESGDLAFDENGDGSVDAADRAIWANDYANTWVGDANLDGEFNSGDFVAVFSAGKFEKIVDATWEEGDWDGDKRFGTSDFVAAFSAGGYEKGPRPAVNAVPEPNARILLLIAGLLLLRRKR